jgi:cation transport regulator ChaC
MLDDGDLWIFGYGSLVWRPAFDHVERVEGSIGGLSRRFWQGSPDHRGRPDAPGRVVTLVPEAGALCGGVVYRIDAAARDDVLRQLDDRESGGFERVQVQVQPTSGAAVALPALTYVAAEGNPNFLGPAPLEEIAAQVRRSRGKSGTNPEYVLRLAGALRAMGMRDAHVFAVAALVVADGAVADAPS